MFSSLQSSMFQYFQGSIFLRIVMFESFLCLWPYILSTSHPQGLIVSRFHNCWIQNLSGEGDNMKQAGARLRTSATSTGLIGSPYQQALKHHTSRKEKANKSNQNEKKVDAQTAASKDKKKKKEKKVRCTRDPARFQQAYTEGEKEKDRKKKDEKVLQCVINLCCTSV